MIPLVLSLMFSVGVGLLYWWYTSPPEAEAAIAENEPGSAVETLVEASGARVSILARALGAAGLQEFLVQAGLHDVTPRAFAVFSLGLGLASALLAQLFLGWGVLSVLAGLLGLVAPLLYYLHRHERRRAALQRAFVDAIAQLRDSLRTGLSIQEGLVGLARSGPAPLRPEFAVLVRDMGMRGLTPALRAMQERLADPVCDTVVHALALNDRVGGRLMSQVLDRLAHATREQLRIQDELRAQQARNVMSARIVAAVPLVVLIAVRKTNPHYLAIFNSASGQVLLAGCAVSIAVGYVAMLWLARPPAERRVLR